MDSRTLDRTAGRTAPALLSPDDDGPTGVGGAAQWLGSLRRGHQSHCRRRTCLSGDRNFVGAWRRCSWTRSVRKKSWTRSPTISMTGIASLRAARRCRKPRPKRRPAKPSTRHEVLTRAFARSERVADQEPTVPGGGGRAAFGTVWQDVKYGFRALRRNPGISASRSPRSRSASAPTRRSSDS